MGDIRFGLTGIALIFVGFIVLGIFGEGYQAATIEADEFGICYLYSDDSEPVEISCETKMNDQMLFFGLVIGFIGAGVLALVKGVRGDWDNRVNPGDMLGPGRSEDGNGNNNNSGSSRP